MNVRKELFENQDLGYKEFNFSLIPNVDYDKIIGVRVPVLRKIAKAVSKESTDFPVFYYEELMVKGLALGYKRCDGEEHIKDVESFVPLIDNWAVCDSFCSNLKFTVKHPEEMLNVIKGFLDGGEFERRFCVVMLMDYYISDLYIDEIFSILFKLKAGDYYCDMAVAWAVSVIYLSYPEKVIEALTQLRFSKFIHNKAIQKMCESYRISNEDKKLLRNLKSTD